MVNRNRLTDKSEMQRDIFVLYHAILIKQTVMRKLCTHTDASVSRVDRACARHVGGTDCSGQCWEWGGLTLQREGSERSKKGKEGKHRSQDQKHVQLMGVCLHALKFRTNTRFH